MKNIDTLDIFKKKYIIFDMDGTLIDSIGIWNITDQRLINQLGGVNVDLALIQKDRETFLETHHDEDIYLEYCNFLIKKYKLLISKEELIKLRWNISSEYLETEMDFKPFAAELINKLKNRGFILVLATLTTQLQIDIYSKKNKKMLDKANISSVFDLILKKEDVKNKKSHPEIYLNILNYFNAQPEECLIFEDSLSGVLAAKGANIEIVNVYDKYSDSDRAAIDEIIDYKINSFEEILLKL